MAAVGAAAVGPWARIEPQPADVIFKLNTRYSADDFRAKLNLGVGAYRTEEGAPYIFSTVAEARCPPCFVHRVAAVGGPLPGPVREFVHLI